MEAPPTCCSDLLFVWLSQSEENGWSSNCEFQTEDEEKGCSKAEVRHTRIVLNCESWKATPGESKNKITGLEMAVISAL